MSDHATHEAAHPNAIDTKYRIVQECLNFFPDGTPLLHIHQNCCATHDEALAVIQDAAQNSIAVYADSQGRYAYEFFGDEYCIEVFYRDENNKKVVTDRYLICEIQEIVEVPEPKLGSILTGNVHHFYKYRNAVITPNKQKNRFVIQMPNGSASVIRHSLSKACGYIDRLHLRKE